MVRIVNVCTGGPYTEGFTYQENLLPKYQRRLGFDVYVICGVDQYSKSGELELVEPCEYVNDSDVHIIRLPFNKRPGASSKFRLCTGLIDCIERLSPDILFVHGCQSVQLTKIAKYVKKHPSTIVYADNHGDYSNSATNLISKYVLHRVIWKYCLGKIAPYVKVFWGVLPARVEFISENYAIPKEKCKLLVMGADDDEVRRSRCPEAIENARKLLNLDENSFVITTGGKIDSAKKQTIDLMKAVNELSSTYESLRLIVFGPVSTDVRDDFDREMDGSSIIHLPWVNASESYDCFSVANLVMFPGRHSVYWEQACGVGRPMVVKRWEGTDHLDCFGNVLYLETSTVDEIKEVIVRVLEDDELRLKMEMAAANASQRFLYSNIAKESVELPM